MLRKSLIMLLAAALIAAVGLTGGAGARTPVATASKYCSAYAEDHFHDKNVRTPGGVKCLGPGETCSHEPGYAAAYRRAGFRCNREGRLEDR